MVGKLVYSMDSQYLQLLIWSLEADRPARSNVVHANPIITLHQVKWSSILLMEEILPQLRLVSLSHYLLGLYISQMVQDFFHQQYWKLFPYESLLVVSCFSGFFGLPNSILQWTSNDQGWDTPYKTEHAYWNWLHLEKRQLLSNIPFSKDDI